MSASYTFAACAMKKGDQLWLRKVMSTKSAKELREIQEELAAVQSMYNRSFISITQLASLQHTIVTKTAEKKLVIKTRSVRSVAELQELHRNNCYQSAAPLEQKPVRHTGVCWSMCELKQKYNDALVNKAAKSKPIICTPVYPVAKLADAIRQRKTSAGSSVLRPQTSIKTQSLGTVSELTHEIRSRASTPTVNTDKPAINTHSANTVAQMVDYMKAIKNKPVSQSRPDIFTHAANPALCLKDQFIHPEASGCTVERPAINTRSPRSVSEVTEQLLSTALAPPVKIEKIIKITSNVAERITLYRGFLKDRALGH